MPRPVEALPCGSRSTTRTFSPMAASAVPRLMAVVVFPTPPFWLARARTRGTMGASVMMVAHGEPKCSKNASENKDLTLDGAPHDHDASMRIGFARDQLRVDTPRFRGMGQFSRYILSLWKQPHRTPFQQRIYVREQLVQRRERPGHHNVEALAVVRDKVLDSPCVDNGRQRERGYDVAEKGRLFLPAFHEI